MPLDNEQVKLVGGMAVALAAGVGIGFVVAQKVGGRVNRKQDLAVDKIVHSVDVEDIPDKKVYCRCWQSKNFPYCDGSHNDHNKATGDNVGPLIVKHKGK